MNQQKSQMSLLLNIILRELSHIKIFMLPKSAEDIEKISSDLERQHSKNFILDNI